MKGDLTRNQVSFSELEPGDKFFWKLCTCMCIEEVFRDTDRFNAVVVDVVRGTMRPGDLFFVAPVVQVMVDRKVVPFTKRL